MNEDNIKFISKCVIVLRNMCVEERTNEVAIKPEDEIDTEIVVSDSAPPMWTGLVTISGEEVVKPLASCIQQCARRCSSWRTK